MQQPPEFLKKGFTMVRVLFCNKCRATTMHKIELICDCPKDEVVHALIVCEYCLQGHNKLEALGIDSTHPVVYQRFFVQPYVFLVLHQNYIDP